MKAILSSLFLATLASVSVGCGHDHSQTDWNDPRSVLSHVFKGQDAAIENGSRVLELLKAGDAGNRQELWGHPVAFYGGGPAPGESANLITRDNVLIDVDLRPYKDIFPKACAWGVGVLGTLKCVDPKKRIIYIEAKPDDWLVFETW